MTGKPMDFTPEVEYEVIRESVSHKLYSPIIESHSVSRGIKEVLTNGEGPISDTNLKAFNLER